MSFRKSLISLSLLALFALPALAQDQTSQTPATPPQASPSAKDQTAQTQSTQPPAPAPPQDPAPTSTPAPDSSSSTSSDTPASAPPPVQEPDDSKVKHDGSKKDVDAIGNRKVGGRGMGDWYSLETEIRMGKQYAMQVEQSVKMVQDPVVNEYVNRIGQNLVRNSDAQVPFTIKVIDSDEVNAFALPGGFFYVNSGLLLAADEEAELAGVMAHEIAHVAARHGTRQATKGQIMEWATIPLIVFGPVGWAGYGLYEGLNLAIPLGFLKFNRDAEREADYLGLQYMYKAGYDPNAFVSFFEKIEAEERRRPGSIPKVFSTHPPTPERVQKAQQEIATILPAREEYIVSTSEFDTIKARLGKIEHRNKLEQKKQGDKPTLRTRTEQQKQDKADKQQTQTQAGDDDPDRPVLKKRPDDSQ
jgi:predicted Zn-dependent protease